MATNIPPHNLGELVDALVALIDQPNLALEKLQAIVPGPDFPTGGEIIGTEGITDAYRTGRGSIPLRAIVNVEEVQPGRGKHRRPALIVTELPYQVNKAGLLERIATYINQGRIEGIADLRDESDRDGMRIVIELKREAHPQAVLEELFRKTPLQTNFGVITLALVDGQPQKLPLQTALQEFLNFREQTLTRHYKHQLTQQQQRLHLVNGLLNALEHLDSVINILRQAPDGSGAKVRLQKDLGLSDRQADAILAMPLRRLTGLEQEKLHTEFDELSQDIQTLERVLGDRRELLKAIKKELRALKRKHNNPRRTKILKEASPLLITPSTPEGPVRLEINQRGYIRYLRISNRGRRKGIISKSNQLQKSQEDWVIYASITNCNTDFLVLTGSGKIYSIPIQDLPGKSSRERGRPLVTFLPDSARNEIIAAQFLAPELLDTTHLLLLTHQGRIKRLPLTEISEITSRGLTVIKLKPSDQVGWALPVQTGKNVAIATSMGRILRVLLSDIPEMGRPAQGNQVMRLRQHEQMVGMVALMDDADLVLISQNGYGKCLPVDLLRLGRLGDLGTPAMQFKQKSDRLVGLFPFLPTSELLLESDHNRIAHVNMDTLKMWGKEGPGSTIVTLNKGEQIAAASSLSLEEKGTDHLSSVK